MILRKNVYIIIDGQAGSSGKGKVCSEFALEEKPELAITNNMPNAGHTCVVNGKKRVFRNIPTASVNKSTDLFFGPGSIIDLDTLKEEYENNYDILGGREIIAHPNIPIIEQRHIDAEMAEIRSGSTFKGCGACLAEKIMRSPDLKMFKGYKSIKVVSYDEYYQRMQEYLLNAKKILIEGAQGCDLDINHSGHYPHTTSRQVSVEQMLADCAISGKYLKKVSMVIRPYPIRISNQTNIGLYINSGHYGNSKELSWLKIEVGSYFGIPAEIVDDHDINNYISIMNKQYNNPEDRFETVSKDDLVKDFPNFSEMTTVTKKIKRVFELDLKKLKRSIGINLPDSIYLNFSQHLDNDLANLSGNFNDYYFNKYLREYLNYLETELGTPIEKLGTGSESGQYIRRLTRKL